MADYYGAPASLHETLTSRGTANFCKAFAALIMAGILGVIASLVAPATVGLTGSLNATANKTDTEILSEFSGVIALSCGLVVVTAIGLFLAVTGLWSMYKGKAEYGSGHEKNVDKAVLFFGVAIAVFVMDIAMTVGIAMAQMIGPEGIKRQASPPSQVLIALSNALSVMMAVAVAFLLYYLVKSLLAAERSDRFVIAMGLNILSPVVTWMLLIPYSPPAEYYASSSSVTFDVLWLLPGLAGSILSLSAMVMFLYLFREVSVRLRTRVIKPVWDTASSQRTEYPEELRWQPPPSA